jgi:hypothetical protein
MRNSEILFKAADVIDQRGWWQGGYIPESAGDISTCPVCVLGAINVAVGNDPDEAFGYGGFACVAAIALARYVEPDEPVASHYKAVTVVGDHWNDTRCASEGDAISALREAAQAEQAAGR